MIQPPLVMNRALSEHRDRQGPLERLLKEKLYWSGLRQGPVAGAIITNERSSSNQSALANRTEPCQLLVAFDLDQSFGNLSIGRGNLLLDAADLQIRIGYGAFALFDLAFGDKAFRKQFARLIAA